MQCFGMLWWYDIKKQIYSNVFLNDMVNFLNDKITYYLQTKFMVIFMNDTIMGNNNNAMFFQW